MAVELNHTIVPAHDPQASAQFLADILGLPVERAHAGSPETGVRISMRWPFGSRK